ncbi:MAG: deoxyribose-phosphate aldolase [Candidatus Azobacteroides sp.]|nr:deoxyribose-phosphate aldolase [Candidatus Azobacteroides sp.]
MGKYTDILKEYKFNLSDEEIKNEIQKLQPKVNKETLKLLFGCMDFTFLNTTDNASHVKKITEKLNAFENEFNEMPNVAAVCAYPSLIQPLRKYLTVNDIAIASVAGGFPSAQTFIEVKIAETALAVAEGAQEIDVVMSIGKFLEGKYDEVGEELEEIKHSCREAKLKVILETEVLTSADIYKASLIAMYAGANFIKTSTGKLSVGATPEAAYIMCRSIADFYKKTNLEVGFKASGGVATTSDAVIYYAIAENILGKERVNRNLFRIGASRLANNLLSNIYEKTIVFF